MALAKLSERCQTCPYLDTCDHKRMEGLGYLPLPEPVAASAVEPSLESLAEPVLRETMTIIINGNPTIVYKDNIEKQLYEDLYKHLRLPGFVQQNLRNG